MPVMYELASEARNKATFAISSGCRVAQERPVEHLACSAAGFVELRPRRAAFDQARGDRVDADAMHAPLHRQLARDN